MDAAANATYQKMERAMLGDNPAQNAAQILFDDFSQRQSAEKNGTLSAGDFQQYQTALMDKFTSSELQTLSVAWVQRNNGLFKDGYLDTGAVTYGANVDTQNPINDRLTKAFVGVLDNNTKIDSDYDGQVSQTELSTWLNNQSLRKDNVSYAQMFSTEAGKRLFDSLDTYKQNRDILYDAKKDNGFDQYNLDSFLYYLKLSNPTGNDKDKHDAAQELIINVAKESNSTPEKVTALLDQMNTGYGNGQFAQLQDSNSGLITLDSIAKGAGFQSIADCASQNLCAVGANNLPGSLDSGSTDAVNTPSASQPTDTAASMIYMNAANTDPLRIDYKDTDNGSMSLTWKDSTSALPSTIKTGDGHTIYQDGSGNWFDNYTENSQNKTVSIANVAFNKATGDLTYNYTGQGAAGVEYRADGSRLVKDSFGTVLSDSDIPGSNLSKTDRAKMVIDELATDTRLFSMVAPDGKTINWSKVGTLLGNYKPSNPNNLTSDEYNTLKVMSLNEKDFDNKSLDQIMQDAGESTTASPQTFEQLQTSNGAKPITTADAQWILSTLRKPGPDGSIPISSLLNDSSFMSKDLITQINSADTTKFTADQQKAINMLKQSYNVFAKGKGEFDPQLLAAPIDLQPIVPIAAADDTSTSTTTTSTDSTSGSVSLVGKSDDVGKDPRGVALARATELAKPNAPTMAQQQQAMWDLFELAFEKNYPVDTSKPATVTRNQQFMAALTKLRATSTDGYTHIMIPQSIDGISWSQILKGTINY